MALHASKAKSLPKLLLIFSLLAFLMFLIFSKQKSTDDSKPYIVIANTKIFIEIANTPEKRAKGLSGRKNLSKNEGMLFVWEKDSHPTFWMKDMNFPIDIIWIKDGKIVKIDKNVPPEPGKRDSQLTLYRPDSPVDYVLEVASGFSDKYSLQVGNSINLTGI